MATEKRFLSLDDLTHLPSPSWLIEGLFEANSLVMLAGPSGHYKSFLAIDWTLSMAAGRKWCNRPTAPAKVLYVLGEGKASLLKRILTWAHYNRLETSEIATLNENFRVSFDVPQLASKASVDNMLAGLSAEGFTPNVIVIDTFARSFVGLDENSAQDTGLWIESADRLRQLGYAVIYLHHTNKNTEFGHKYRGSSAIMGAMDTAMVLARDGSDALVKLEVIKQKDHDEGQPMYFQRLVIKYQDGDLEGSCVLVPTAKVDERFTQEFIENEDIIKEVMKDPAYASDWERARAIAPKLNISEDAAQGRIKRRRKDMVAG